MSDTAAFPAQTRIPPAPLLRRVRLARALERVWVTPVTIVAAPGGSGKTSTMAAFARAWSSAGACVSWYQADRAISDEAGLVAHLAEALRPVVPALPADVRSLAQMLTALVGVRQPDVALIIDDAHVWSGREPETVLGDLIERQPDWLHLVLGARRPFGFDVSRLRVADQLLELGPEDLRFRSWEVEELFHSHGHDLTPEEIAEVARRTGGWAAGLHLFHLAIRGKPPAQRHQILVSLPTKVQSCREYLARNVLAGLDDDWQEFLIAVSPLGLLTARWCDELLGWRNSASLLSDLTARHLFLTTTDDVSYRLHEVLRGHLEQLLVERKGEREARAHCHRAAQILEAGGALGEAWRAYCRAQDWVAAERMLGRSGGDILDAGDPWCESALASLADHDGWMLLARARHQVGAGRWAEALTTYRRAERVAEGSVLSRLVQGERFLLEGWVDPGQTPAIGWSGTLRAALSRRPATVPGPGEGVSTALSVPDEERDRVAAAVAALAAGSPSRAWTALNETGTADQAVEGWAGMVSGLLAWLLGRPGGAAIAANAARTLEPGAMPWLAYFLAAVGADEPTEVVAAAERAEKEMHKVGNAWLTAVFGLILGVASARAGAVAKAEEAFGRARDAAAEAGASVLEGWAAVLRAESVVRGGGNAAALGRARDEARSAGNSGAAGVAAIAESIRSGKAPSGPEVAVWDRADVEAWRRMLEEPAQSERQVPRVEGATAGPVVVPPDAAGGDLLDGDGRPNGRSEGADAEGVSVRCFGEFELFVGGKPVDVERAQPKVRSLLQILALNAGKPVHRDRLVDDLWPADHVSGNHSLQVAVSALRKYLDQAFPSAGAVVARRRDAYVLEVGEGSSDVIAFSAAIRRAQACRASGDNAGAADAHATALAVYRDDLLSDAGNPEWVIEPRQLFRNLAADASAQLAEERLRQGDIAGSVEAAARGLVLDRYRDRLWRAMIAAHEQAGDLAAAGRASADYAEVLTELGLDPNSAGYHPVSAARSDKPIGTLGRTPPAAAGSSGH